MNKTNKLRKILEEYRTSLATRVWSTWPLMIEAIGSTGNYDYVEFVGEYTPFSQMDLENMARAAELHDMGLMMKVDFQNRGYVAQKAIASGVQAILFTDCRSAEDVRESVRLVMPETAQDQGLFGYPNRRFIGFQPYLPQMDHARRQRDIVRAFMIEKKSAVDDIEAICSVPGVDMIQFGPSDYAMSCGVNLKDYRSEVFEIEKKVIAAAQKHNIAVRCEIPTLADAEKYIDLGVKHFSLGDEMKYLLGHWQNDGGALKERTKDL